MNSYVKALHSTELVRRIGKVTQFYGLIVESSGPDVFLGEYCEILSANQQPVPAEVVGLKDGKVLLMPYGELRGIRMGSEVVAKGRRIQVPVGPQLLGRILDAFGNPLDGKSTIEPDREYPLYNDACNPMERPVINEVLETGVRVVDTLLTLGLGQRLGIFAGSGVGKSTLLGMIAKNAKADVNVIALIGERGREVREFVEEIMDVEAMQRTVVIVATSDQPALVRTHAALTATAIAEYFRDQGLNVVFSMDSITRFAMAQREIGLAIGEPPTAREYTPSVFAALPKLLERGGTHSSGGSITALYTVLVEGDDLNDPVADSVRAILDGHIVLSRDLVHQQHFPSIDILQSKSRLQSRLLQSEELKDVEKLLKLLSAYEKSKDMVELGAYKSGANPLLDKAIKHMPNINKFLCQTKEKNYSRKESVSELNRVLRDAAV